MRFVETEIQCQTHSRTPLSSAAALAECADCMFTTTPREPKRSPSALRSPLPLPRGLDYMLSLVSSHNQLYQTGHTWAGLICCAHMMCPLALRMSWTGQRAVCTCRVASGWLPYTGGSGVERGVMRHGMDVGDRAHNVKASGLC